MEFSRTKMLLGKEGLEKLRKVTVMVLGIGGVGGHCIEALARSGIGHLILVDNDKVSVSNINRQIIALQSTVGQWKTQVMKQRIGDIYPKTKVTTYETFVLKENLEELFPVRPDYIVDAIDTVSAKLAVAEYAQKAGIPLISCMGTGNKLDPKQFEITDIYKTSVCPLCKVMRRECRARGIKKLKVLYSKETPAKVLPAPGETIPEGKRSIPGSIAFVPSVAGLYLAGQVVEDLLAEK